MGAWVNDPVTGGFRAGFDAEKQKAALARFKIDAAAYLRDQKASAAAGSTVTTNHGDVSVGDVHIHTASNDPATHGRLVNDSIRNLAYPSNSGVF